MQATSRSGAAPARSLSFLESDYSRADFSETDLDSSSRIGIPNQYAVAVPSGENVMKIVPVVRSNDLERSVRFYTEVLDFERKWPDDEDRENANGVAHLNREGPSCCSLVMRETVSSVRSIASLWTTWMNDTLPFAHEGSTRHIGLNLRFIPRQSTKPGASVNLQ